MIKDPEMIKKRRKEVYSALGILLTDSKMPNNKFMAAVEEYIIGNITLEQLDKRTHELEFIN